MLKKIISATLAVVMAAAVTTSAYAAENIMNSISAGVGKKLTVSSDSNAKPAAMTVSVKKAAMTNVVKGSGAVMDTGVTSGSGAMKIISIGDSDARQAAPENKEPASVPEDTQDETDTGAVESEKDEEEDSVPAGKDLCVANVDDIMNIRAEASEDAKVVGYMYKDCVGEILENGDGWTRIKSGALEGWAKNDYLIFGKEAKKKTEISVRDIAVINADALRIRAEASEDAEVKAMLSEGDEVDVIEADEEWTKISFEDGTEGEDTGYVSSEYISIKSTYKTGETVEEVKDREEKSKAAKEAAEKNKKDKEEKKKESKSDSKQDGDESAVAEESQNSKPAVTNNGGVSASVDDETLLAALIQCECNGPYEAQLAVGAVVVNRANAGYGSISNAIYAPHQFGPASSGKLAATIATGAISGSARQAAKDAISGVSNVGNARYFRNVKSGHEGVVIGNHVYW